MLGPPLVRRRQGEIRQKRSRMASFEQRSEHAPVEPTDHARRGVVEHHPSQGAKRYGRRHWQQSATAEFPVLVYAGLPGAQFATIARRPSTRAASAVASRKLLAPQ